MPASIGVDFAGAVIQFDLSCPSLHPLIENRYHQFISSENRVRFTLRWEADVNSDYGYEDGNGEDHGVLHSGPETRHLDLALRSLLPTVVDGAVFHCALLRDEHDRGYVCCGMPGAGKSTIARLLPEHALCDEMAVVDGDLEAHSLPYWSSRPGSAGLAGVFILNHGPRNRRTRLEPLEAFQQLSSHVYWPTGNHSMHIAVGVVGAIADRIPVWRLEFKPDAEVWRVITEEAP